MKQLTTLFLSSIMMVAASTASAADEGISITFDPALGSSLTEFPATFTMSFSGDNLQSITKPVLGGNPVMVLAPGASGYMQCTAVYDGCDLIVTTNKAVDRTLEGDYTVQLIKDKVVYVDFEGNKTNCTMQEFTYTVGGSSSGDDPGDETGVAYDIAMTKVNPISSGDDLPYVDLNEKDFNILQMTFSMANLKPMEGAMATITGPGYDMSAPIEFVMNGFTGTTCVMKAAFDAPTYNGVYTLTIPQGVIGDADYVADRNTGHANAAVDFRFEVLGAKDMPEEGAKYDIDMTGFTPCTSATDSSVDISQKEFKPLVQMTFNMTNLQAVEGAVVTITGPGYNQSGAISFNMNGWDGKSCKMKAAISSDPVYNGEYTIHIDKGMVGDADYIADHNTGHANAEINYVIEVYGGKDPSEMGVDTSLGITSSIASSSTVATLAGLKLAFDEKVYFDETVELKVKYMANLQSSSYVPFGNATFSRLSDTEVEVVFDPVPVGTANMAEYWLEIPEGTFWNEAHELDAEAGKVNGASSLKWYLLKEIVYVDVTSHSPRTDQYVDGFDTDEGIIFYTTNDDEVALMTITLTQYEMGNDYDMGTKILDNVACTTKLASGAPCWINEGAYMPCGEDYWYEVSAEFYNAAGDMIGDCMFEFYGNNNGTVGVAALGGNAAAGYVFNLQGVRVNRSADALPAGVYVIGGKKVFVTK